MSVFFSSEPVPSNPQLAKLWQLLEDEQFEGAITLAEGACKDTNAPIEFFCGLSLAYGECGYYADAEHVARRAVSFGETHWRARHALAVSLMHQDRFLGALDSLGFHRDPPELYAVRAQVETMGNYLDGLQVTLEDALEIPCPPAIRLYLAYLYGALAETVQGWGNVQAGFREVVRHGAYLDVWKRDAARHQKTLYGKHLGQHITNIQRILR
jgi:hypothetical protein